MTEPSPARMARTARTREDATFPIRPLNGICILGALPGRDVWVRLGCCGSLIIGETDAGLTPRAYSSFTGIKVLTTLALCHLLTLRLL